MSKQNNEPHCKYQRVSAVLTGCQALKDAFSGIVTLNKNPWVIPMLKPLKLMKVDAAPFLDAGFGRVFFHCPPSPAVVGILRSALKFCNR